MQSGLGLLTYQGQTGAVGHGEYFFFHFGASTSGIHASLLPFHPFTPTRLSPYFGAMSVSLFVYGVSIPPCRPFILLHLPTRLPFPPTCRHGRQRRAKPRRAPLRAAHARLRPLLRPRQPRRALSLPPAQRHPHGLQVSSAACLVAYVYPPKASKRRPCPLNQLVNQSIDRPTDRPALPPRSENTKTQLHLLRRRLRGGGPGGDGPPHLPPRWLRRTPRPGACVRACVRAGVGWLID